MSANSSSSEYQRLYTLLSSLSSKTRVGPEPPVVPMISIFEDTKRTNRSNRTVRHKRSQDDGKETSKEELKEPLCPFIEEEEQLHPLIEENDTERKGRKPIIGEIEEKTEKEKKAENAKKYKTFECTGCFKRYRTRQDLETHYKMTEMCKRWMALPNHEEYGTPALPIHMFLDKLLTRSITGDQPLKCRFCGTTFVNRGNHHKHFYNAYVCNRLAFAECKQLLQTLQIEQRK